MAYKRRRSISGTSPQHLSSSRGQSSRLSSVPNGPLPSSPSLPPFLPAQRNAEKAAASHVAHAVSPRLEDVAHAVSFEADDETQLREETDAVNEVIMAVDMRDRGTIGCAYYLAREEKLCLIGEIKMAGLDIIDTLKLHVQPTTILICVRSDEKLEDHLSREARGIDRGDEASKIVVLFTCTLN